VQSGAVPGTRLDDRYRLDELLHQSGAGVTLWRATDEVLGRPVAIRIVADQTQAQCAELTAAATRAGRVPDARWVRVLDVGSDGPEDELRVWVVSEWVDGPSLATLVRDAPLRGPIATGLIASCAQAVEIARSHGASHGALHPDEVVLPADGSPRLTGLELSAALRPTSSVDDTRGLGGLLYAALTGRWPLPGWDGLPAPSKGDGIHPRRHRRGVSRELDQITATALSGQYPDAGALADDLAGLETAPLHPPPVDPDRPRNRRARRLAWRVVPPLLVAAVGVGAWTLGSDLGRVPSPARAAAPSFPQPRQSNHTTTNQVVWSAPPHITSFDPEGDGTEDPGGVGLAVDDDPSTQWTTDTYIGNPVFGGLKHGVGLLLDLRQPTTVDVAQLLLSAPGADIEIRAGSVRPVQASDLPVVASRDDSPASVRLTLATPIRARYWLLWITSLPKAGGGYRLGVSEIALLD
jgi:serine/threonine protein kinase